MQQGYRGLIALLVLGLATCTPAPRPPLVVGTVPWVGTEPLYLARERKLYPAGEIHLAEYVNNPQRLQAFRNGVIDAANLTLDEVMSLDQLGHQVRIVLVLDTSHGADCLVARPEVSTLADLKGRRVASEDVPLSAYLLQRILDQVGLRSEDVHRVFVNPDEQQEDFQSGAVDAVVTYEPYCQHLVAAGARCLFDSSRIPGEIIDVLAVRESSLRAHPEQVDMLIRGWFAALAYFQAHPSEAARQMGPRLGLDGPQFLESMKGVRHPDAREQHALLTGERPRLADLIERLGELMVEQQLLPAPPNVRRLFDPAPLLRVAP